MLTKKYEEAGQLVIAEAERWLGFVPLGNLHTPFGEKTGYDQTHWAGSFIDFVYHEAGVSIPSCVYPPNGLREFMHNKQFHFEPRPGDVVFFSTPTGDRLGMPHVGIVADVARWKTTKQLGTIEAQVNSGLSKADTQALGVFRRVRTYHEVIGFGRPNTRSPKVVVQSTTGVLLNKVRPDRRNKDVGLVQQALKLTVGLQGNTVDQFDGLTRAAYAHYQRTLGYIGDDASGVPDMRSLIRLGEVTGVFRVDQEPATS